MNVDKFIEIAIKAAMKGCDHRKHFVGAVAIRPDGAIVWATNGTSPNPDSRTPSAHAEVRCLRKASKGSIIFVARIGRNGKIGLAKPCPNCETALRNKGMSKVFYTTDDGIEELEM